MPGDLPLPTEQTLSLAQVTQSIFATAEVASLDREAERDRLSVANKIALQDADLRQWMTSRIVRAFIWASGMTLAALATMAVLDETNIATHLFPPDDRIITPQVLMSLLGATTVQVGTIAAVIARYLFPGRLRGG